jgi:hypothetical protein
VTACPERECALNFSVEPNDGCIGFFPPGSRCQPRVPTREPSVVKRLRRLRQANDFITGHLGQPIYFDDLCVELDLTPRAVNSFVISLA